jgi:hypothetical protein
MQALSMQARSAIGLFLAVALLPSAAEVRQGRSSAVTAAFQRANPCPSTRLPAGACPGWIKDHVVPLCAGGLDHPDNLQWQTVDEAKAKDRDERKLCARRRDFDAAR